LKSVTRLFLFGSALEKLAPFSRWLSVDGIREPFGTVDIIHPATRT